MRQLKQQRAAGAEKDNGLPVDPPGHRRRAEHAGDRSRCVRPDPIEDGFKIVPGHHQQGLSIANEDERSARPVAIR
jgi:hypothetical protein